MYNTLNVLLMFTALAVPYVCLCKHFRQKLWPVITALICGSGFLVLQIALLALRV